MYLFITAKRSKIGVRRTYTPDNIASLCLDGALLMGSVSLQGGISRLLVWLSMTSDYQPILLSLCSSVKTHVSGWQDNFLSCPIPPCLWWRIWKQSCHSFSFSTDEPIVQETLCGLTWSYFSFFTAQRTGKELQAERSVWILILLTCKLFLFHHNLI